MQVAEIRAHLAAVVAGFEPGLLSAADAAAVLEEFTAIGNLAATGVALCAGRVSETELWRHGGERSPEEWLARRTGTSKRQAKDAIETAWRLAALPETDAALRRGELSIPQAAAVSNAAAADPTAERRLLERAGTESLRGLQEEAARVKAAATPDLQARRAEAYKARSLRFWNDADGVTAHLHLTGPIDYVAGARANIEARAGQRFREARARGEWENHQAYCADALVDLVTGDAAGGGTPKVKIIFRIDYQTWLRGHAAPGETCEILGLGPVPVAVVDEMMRDAFVAAVLTNGTDIAGVCHLGRKATALMRTALEWRDTKCEITACDARLGLELDHDTPWADSHVTRLEDLQWLCRHDHWLKTHNGYQVIGPPSNRRLIPPHEPDPP